MADQVSAVPTARASVTRPSTGWAGRIGWTVFIVGYLVFAVLTIVNLQSGLHGDPRLTNPHPGPAPYPPAFGFDNWPRVISLSAIPLMLGMFGILAWLSLRQRRVHWGRW